MILTPLGHVVYASPSVVSATGRRHTFPASCPPPLSVWPFQDPPIHCYGKHLHEQFFTCKLTRCLLGGGRPFFTTAALKKSKHMLNERRERISNYVNVETNQHFFYSLWLATDAIDEIPAFGGLLYHSHPVITLCGLVGVGEVLCKDSLVSIGEGHSGSLKCSAWHFTGHFGHLVP